MRLDGPAAGRQLNASYVVEGSTQRLGDRVRVNARLLQVDSGRALWADTFDVRPQEVFTLHDRIANSVASILAVRLGAMPTPGSSPCDGRDAQAYRAYLSGLYLMSRPDPVRLPKALAAFRRAIELDPACARAYAGMVYAYHGQVITGDRAPHQMFPLAKAAAEQALRIDPESAEAHTAKGFSQFWYDWDWAGAETSFKRAIALNPNLAAAWFYSGYVKLWLGEPNTAIEHFARAMRFSPVDPTMPRLQAATADAHFHAGRHDEAAAWVALALRDAPDHHNALRINAAANALIGQLERAGNSIARLRQLDPMLARRERVRLISTGRPAGHGDMRGQPEIELDSSG
jgi:tetratricopeptide (TPR) repeat protein